jgi:hypothetical protein
MIAVKAHFDGERIVFGQDAPDVPPGDVIVVFEGSGGPSSETHAWMKTQESAFARIWSNDEDAVYDSL